MFPPDNFLLPFTAFTAVKDFCEGVAILKVQCFRVSIMLLKKVGNNWRKDQTPSLKKSHLSVLCQWLTRWRHLRTQSSGRAIGTMLVLYFLLKWIFEKWCNWESDLLISLINRKICDMLFLRIASVFNEWKNHFLSHYKCMGGVLSSPLQVVSGQLWEHPSGFQFRSVRTVGLFPFHDQGPQLPFSWVSCVPKTSVLLNSFPFLLWKSKEFLNLTSCMENHSFLLTEQTDKADLKQSLQFITSCSFGFFLRCVMYWKFPFPCLIHSEIFWEALAAPGQR
jgi:hypothetical protein